MLTTNAIQQLSLATVVTPGTVINALPPPRAIQALNGDLTISNLTMRDQTGRSGSVTADLGTDLIIKEGNIIYGNFSEITVNVASVGFAFVYLQ